VNPHDKALCLRLHLQVKWDSQLQHRPLNRTFDIPNGMTITRKFILRQLRDFFFFILASFVQTYLMCPRCRDNTEAYMVLWAFTFAVWVILWKGNELLAQYLSRLISWIEFPTRRFVVGTLCAIAYTVMSVIGLMWIFEKGLNVDFGRGYTYTIYGSIVITIVISLFMHGRAFLSFWRAALVEKEKLQKESIVAKYESLKNQVNPHFLFNNLNALTNIVYEDREKAVKFIKQLSDVYRYVLDSRDQEVVPLKDELEFLQAYTSLQQIRFGDKLSIRVSLPDGESYVAPLALQMLIENAIKHNVISEDDPLAIRVYQEDGYIVVRNNLQRKAVTGEPSSGVGLENIARRYELLTDKKVVVQEDAEAFTVKIPVLTKAAR